MPSGSAQCGAHLERCLEEDARLKVRWQRLAGGGKLGSGVGGREHGQRGGGLAGGRPPGGRARPKPAQQQWVAPAGQRRKVQLRQERRDERVPHLRVGAAQQGLPRQPRPAAPSTRLPELHAPCVRREDHRGCAEPQLTEQLGERSPRLLDNPPL